MRKDEYAILLLKVPTADTTSIVMVCFVDQISVYLLRSLTIFSLKCENDGGGVRNNKIMFHMLIRFQIQLDRC